MGELQCALEFSLELHKFINIDLFQRGFYQIRATLKNSSKFPTKIKVSLPHNSACSLVFPACIINGTAVSKTFQILYKNEEVFLNDLIIFKVDTVVDEHKIRESLLKADFRIVIDLWFTDQSFGIEKHNSIHCVSSRTLLLHFDPYRGLHHHLPLLFDYFHLCAVTVTIHASILGLCQPCLRKDVIQTPNQSNTQRSNKQVFLVSSPRLSNKKSYSYTEAAIFLGSQLDRNISQKGRLYQAKLVHWEMCYLLLSAYNGLCQKLVEYMVLLPPWQQLEIESLDSPNNFENLSKFAKECYKCIKRGSLVQLPKDELFLYYECVSKNIETEDDFLTKASSDLVQICGALILIWQQFLEIVAGEEKIQQYLSRQHHFQRIKRFSEAFFIVKKPCDSILFPCDNSVECYQEVSEALRRSSYLTLLPPLEVECIELDGDFNSLPVVYEEHFQIMEQCEASNNQNSDTEPAVKCDINSLVDNAVEKKSAINSHKEPEISLDGEFSDISITPSPSAPSLCPNVNSSLTNPLSLTVKKHTYRNTSLNNFKMDSESDFGEYNIASRNLPRINHKIMLRSKIKLRSKTINFLRQMKRNHFIQAPTSVMLMGVRKLESNHTVTCDITNTSAVPFIVESGIRHSQSTLSMMSTLYADEKTFLSNSESMPDLTSDFIPPPPPPPPPHSKFRNSDLDWAALDLSIQNYSKFPYHPMCNTSVQKVSCSKKNSPELTCYEILGKSSFINASKIGGKTGLRVYVNDKKRISSPQINDDSHNSKEIEKKKDIPNKMSFSASKLKTELSKLKYFAAISNQNPKAEEKYLLSTKIKNKEHNNISPFLVDNFNSLSNSSPDLTSGLDVCDICPPSPPMQFRDPPEKDNEKNIKAVKANSIPYRPMSKVSNKKKSSESCLTTINCQGTLFFPKPPAEFASDDFKESNSHSFVSSSSSISHDVKNYDSLSDVNASEMPETPEIKTEFETVENLAEFADQRCTIFEMLTAFPSDDISSKYSDVNAANERHRSYSLVEPVPSIQEDASSIRRASVIGTETKSFTKAKEEFRKQLHYSWLWYSDNSSFASSVPYFQCDNDLRAFSPTGLHLVICVHGLDGNSADLRLVRTYLELGLPTVNFEFLMSERNQGETFDDFEVMTDRLVSEISYYIEVYGLKPTRISFIGHSLGNIIIRSALTRAEMKPYLRHLYTFLSLSGPHLGTLYNNSGLVNMGMWFMQKWKKSGSLLQLSMKDSSDLRQTFLYKLSKTTVLENFRNILLFGSSQDRYVPLHSARIEMCKSALKDTSIQGVVYREMVTNLLQPIMKNPDIALHRYDVHHALPSSANSLIGRAAHIAVLDSELFIEKFLTVCGLKFFT